MDSRLNAKSRSRRRKEQRQRAKALMPKPGKVSDEVYLAEIDRRHTYAKAVRAVLTIVAFAVPILAMWPVARVLSGRTTTVDIEVTLVFTLSVTLAGAAGWAWGNRQRKRADRLQQRNDTLSRDVRELQQRLKANSLDFSVTRE